MNELVSLLSERSERAFRTGKPNVTPFLRAEEVRAAGIRAPYRLFGGAPDAERAVFVALPEESFPVREEDFVRAVSVTVNDKNTYSHRDYLGSILSLGVRRDCVGDLLVTEGGCWVCTTPAVAAFLADELKSVSRTGCRCRLAGLSERPVSVREEQSGTVSVSSCRLDGLIAAVFGLSRNDAKSLVEKGLCSVNGAVCEKGERSLSQGDAVSLRGYGKFALGEAEGISRKGKMRFAVSGCGKCRLSDPCARYK